MDKTLSKLLAFGALLLSACGETPNPSPDSGNASTPVVPQPETSQNPESSPTSGQTPEQSESSEGPITPKGDYLKELSGTYVLTPKGSEPNLSFGLANELPSSEWDSPSFGLLPNGGIPFAGQRIIFKKNAEDAMGDSFFLSTSFDRGGYAEVKDISLQEGQPIVYHFGIREGEESSLQKWRVYEDEKHSYQIELADHPSYKLCSLDSSSVIVSSSIEAQEFRWDIVPSIGTYGVDTSIYSSEVVDSAAGERVLCDRYLDPLGGESHPYLSSTLNVGIAAEGAMSRRKDGLLSFGIPFQSKFFLKTGFVYAHPGYPAWETDLTLGHSSNHGGDGDWKLALSEETIETEKDGIVPINNGVVLLEISEDNVTYRPYRALNFTSNLKEDAWEIDGELLLGGVYFRVSHLFRIYSHWVTGWWMWEEQGDDFKDIAEVSEPFYVCPIGFGEEGFGAVSIHNLTLSTEEDLGIDVEGFDGKDIRFAETLTDGALTTTGFSVETRFPTYQIEIIKDGGNPFIVENGYEEKRPGVYLIRVTDAFGQEKEMNVTICPTDNLLDAYFGGAAFSSEIGGKAFLSGQRVLSGSSAKLEELGLNLPYSWADVPVYVKGAKYSILAPQGYPSLQGKILEASQTEEDAIEVSTENGVVEGTLDTPGHYYASFMTSNHSGEAMRFDFEWYIIENGQAPYVNQQMIEHVFRDVYDLLPIYYSVRLEQGGFTYQEGGRTIEKRGVLNFAFASYSSAYSFALRIEKQYVTSAGDGMYTYLNSEHPEIPMNEYEVFQAMSANAENNVKQRYFMMSNEFTIRGLSGHSELHYEGYVYYYGDDPKLGPIVTNSTSERDALTSKVPLLNHYEFVSIPLDSTSVSLLGPNQKTYAIEYGVPVGEQLKNQGAPSGKYHVTEVNQYGLSNTYDAYYIEEKAACATTVDMLIDGSQQSFSSLINKSILHLHHGFKITDAKNAYDKHGIIVVTFGGVPTAMDIANIPENSFEEPGTYTVHVEDRVGNYYEFSILID